MFKKLLIANRGEIALRIIRTCKEMGIKTVAVYSTADRESLHVRFADEAVCIGPPQSKDSYLSMSRILAAAEITNADAIHPGYGFLSENSKFSALCRDHGIKFIGATPEQAISVANEMGYPVIMKATAGGGGRGMRIVWKDEEVEPAWNSAKQEAGAAFGNDGLYMEKYIEDPRHIEIQIAGDQYGKVCHLSERDCSIQRRHQKLLEETPSPFMTPELREKMGEAAKAAAQIINYEGVGTVEFLVDKHRNFYFMEMNTRIQVEHPVTEEVINYDLVKEQILIAAGVPISGKDHYPTKHAIECRINAEDIHNNFRPSPGKITQLNRPGGHGVRVDTHIYAGYTIPPFYDSMVAKLIVSAQTREEAIVKMERALGEFVIEGVKTTVPLHLQLMRDPDFRAGNFTTAFMNTFEIK